MWVMRSYGLQCIGLAMPTAGGEDNARRWRWRAARIERSPSPCRTGRRRTTTEFLKIVVVAKSRDTTGEVSDRGLGFVDRRRRVARGRSVGALLSRDSPSAAAEEEPDQRWRRSEGRQRSAWRSAFSCWQRPRWQAFYLPGVAPQDYERRRLDRSRKVVKSSIHGVV